MIVGIDHIEFIVRDVKAHVEFYQKLGFKLLRWTDHHEGSAELQLPGENQPIIEIHQLMTEENPGCNHISWKVRDLDGTYSKLTTDGLNFFMGPHVSVTGRKNAEARDPDGWRVQFTDEKRFPVKEIQKP